MLPLFEMMMRAQNGAAMEAMARQFNLAQEQATKAVAALMPAFSTGLKRNAANPYDFSALLGAMTSGSYTKYFEDMAQAFTPQGLADGNKALERMFGSNEITQAIAAQAAQFTGIGQDIFKQMMPAMAGIIMGGLAKQAAGQMPQTPNPFAGTPMGQMAQQWLENTGFAPKPRAPEPANFFDNPFTKAFQEMMGLQTAKAKAPTEAANPFLDNPFTKAFQEMMAGLNGQQAQPASKAEPAPATKAAPKPEPIPEMQQAPFVDMVNAMFDSGLEVQKNYQKNMEAIFEGYVKSANGAAPANGAPSAPK